MPISNEKLEEARDILALVESVGQADMRSMGKLEDSVSLLGLAQSSRRSKLSMMKKFEHWIVNRRKDRNSLTLDPLDTMKDYAKFLLDCGFTCRKGLKLYLYTARNMLRETRNSLEARNDGGKVI